MKMTREDILARIDDEGVFLVQYFDSKPRVHSALRAVVELHRPEEQEHKQYEKCWNCNLLYPCPTIQAIEKELS